MPRTDDDSQLSEWLAHRDRAEHLERVRQEEHAYARPARSASDESALAAPRFVAFPTATAPLGLTEQDAWEGEVAQRLRSRSTWPILVPAVVCALAIGGIAAHKLGVATAPSAREREQQTRVEQAVQTSRPLDGELNSQVHDPSNGQNDDQATAHGTPSDATVAVASQGGSQPKSETLAAFQRLGESSELPSTPTPRVARRSTARTDLSGIRVGPWVRTKYEVRKGPLDERPPTTPSAPSPPSTWADSRGPTSDWAQAEKPTPQPTRRPPPKPEEPNPSSDPLFGL